MYKLLTMASLLALTGCVSTSEVLEMGRDTYSVSATADGYRDAASASKAPFNQAHKNVLL